MATDQTLASTTLLGSAPSVQKALLQIARYKHLTEPVLILGESGTGKELAAQSLIPEGQKCVAVNCAKFLSQESVFESEVFGHVRGAFSGASCDRWGLIQEAEGGVLFLDEVHTLSLSTQQKLLRVLQDQSYRRVGEARERRLQKKFRLIAAAKDDLHRRMQKGAFLPDFYFRIHTLTLEMVPLRERLEDLEVLSRHFLKQIRQQTGLRRHLSREVLDKMREYSWPGNIRELKNCLYRLSVDAPREELELEDFQSYLQGTGAKLLEGEPSGETATYRQFLQRSEVSYFQSLMLKCTSKQELLEKAQVSKSTLYRKLAVLNPKLIDHWERLGKDPGALRGAQGASALRPS